MLHSAISLQPPKYPPPSCRCPWEMCSIKPPLCTWILCWWIVLHYYTTTSNRFLRFRTHKLRSREQKLLKRARKIQHGFLFWRCLSSIQRKVGATEQRKPFSNTMSYAYLFKYIIIGDTGAEYGLHAWQFFFEPISVCWPISVTLGCPTCLITPRMHDVLSFCMR